RPGARLLCYFVPFGGRLALFSTPALAVSKANCPLFSPLALQPQAVPSLSLSPAAPSRTASLCSALCIHFISCRLLYPLCSYSQTTPYNVLIVPIVTYSSTSPALYTTLRPAGTISATSKPTPATCQSTRTDAKASELLPCGRRDTPASAITRRTRSSISNISRLGRPRTPRAIQYSTHAVPAPRHNIRLAARSLGINERSGTSLLGRLDRPPRTLKALTVRASTRSVSLALCCNVCEPQLVRTAFCPTPNAGSSPVLRRNCTAS
ncbi:hypothetical protein FKP32DRAFT_1649006, partial [Trametes sanguinea]